MKHLTENHRQFARPYESAFGLEMNRLLYQQAPEVAEAPQAAAETPSATVAEIRTPQQTWDTEIEPKYSVEAYKKIAEEEYQKAIRAAADKATPASGAENLLERSITYYSRNIYEPTMREFFMRAGDLEKKRNMAVEKLRDETDRELGRLREAVSRGAEARDSGNEAKKIGEDFSSWLDKQNDVLKYPKNNEVKDKFRDYIKAMNECYMNLNWQRARLTAVISEINTGESGAIPIVSRLAEKGVPILFPKPRRETAIEYYEKKSEQFSDRMAAKYSAIVEYMLNNKMTNKESLKNLQKQIEEEYAKYAGADKRPGMIDVLDFAILDADAAPEPDIKKALTAINTSNEAEDRKMLEAAYLMNPEAWETTVDWVGQRFIDTTINNGTEAKFIEAANGWRKEKEGEETPLEDFSDAKAYFRKMMASYAEMGVDKTYEFVMYFNRKVNESPIAFMESVNPKSLRKLVEEEYGFLLAGKSDPERKGDELILQFVRSDLDGRRNMLSTRGEELFREIRNVQKYYQKKYEDRYERSIPKEANKISKRSTFHKEAARLQAMILLAKEAEWIIGNIDKKSAAQLSEIKPDEQPIHVGVKFKDTTKSEYAPYRSSVFRGGFNGRDLVTMGVKIFASATVIVNALNSIRAAEGKGIDKIINAIEGVVTNPGVLGGAAAAFGAHTLEKNPEYYGYISAGEYGRMEMSVTRRLRELAERGGRDYVKKFVGNDYEWKAMDKLSAAQIKVLMEKSSKRRPPHITKKDLAAYITDKETLIGIAEDFNSAHLRYQFYRRFITGTEKPNITELKEMCQKNKIIS